MSSSVSCSVNARNQAVILVQFSDGGVAEIVAYMHQNGLQVSIDSASKHETTVTVDQRDVYPIR